MPGVTLLARMLLDNKKFRAQLKRTGADAGRDFKKSASTALAAVSALTLGLAAARRQWVATTDAASTSAAQFGKSVKDMAARANDLAKKGVGKDAEETASAYALLARMGVENIDVASGLLYEFQQLADATGGELLPTIGEVGTALLSMGYELTDVTKHSDAFTFVAQKTTIQLSDFTAYLAENKEALREQNVSIQDSAAGLYLLEAQGHLGAAAVGKLTEAVQGADVFGELWTEHMGMTRLAVRELAVSIGEGDAQTKIFSDAVHANDDAWHELSQTWKFETIPWLGETASETGHVVRALFWLGEAAEEVSEPVQQAFSGISQQATLSAAYTSMALHDILGTAQDTVGPLGEALAAPWERARAAAEAYVQFEHAQRALRAGTANQDFLNANPGAAGAATTLYGTGPNGSGPQVTTPIHVVGPAPDTSIAPPPTREAEPQDGISHGQPGRRPYSEHWTYDSYILSGSDAQELARRMSFPSVAALRDMIHSEGYFTPFANGGIVTGPTLGLVGEAGPEAIIPLRSMSDIIADALVPPHPATQTVDALGGAGTSGGGGGNVTIVIHHLEMRDAKDLLNLARSKGVGWG